MLNRVLEISTFGLMANWLLHVSPVAFYRVTKPLHGVPAGDPQILTIPIGALIERRDTLSIGGLTDIIWDGKRVSVMVQDLADRVEAMGEDG
jgi:hypothetical protein